MISSRTQLVYLISTFISITPTSFGCNVNQNGSQQYFRFYYREGSYHVLCATPPIENMGISVVGCTNLDHPSRIVGEWNSNGSSNLAYQCVILYGQRDCQAPQLEPPSKFHSNSTDDEIKSFHLCSRDNGSLSNNSTEESDLRPHPPQKLRYSLYDNLNYDRLLYRYFINKCTNLGVADDKKVSSVDTFGNCLELFENKNCLGPTFRLNDKSVGRLDLSSVGWSDRASSLKPCGRYLQGKITAFRPTGISEEAISDGYDQMEIVSLEHFENNGTHPMWKTFDGRSVFNDTFTFEKIQSLSLLQRIEIISNISIDGVKNLDRSCHPLVCFIDDDDSVNWKIMEGLKNAYRFPSLQQQRTQGGEEDPSMTITITREFPIKKLLMVPPCSKLEVRVFILSKENISLKFQLGICLSGENPNGQPMTAAELRQNLPKNFSYLRDKNEFEIFVKVEGRVLATLGLKPEVEAVVLERSIPDCRMTQEPPPSTTLETSNGDDETQAKDEFGTGSGEENLNFVEILSKYKIHLIVVGVFMICTIARLRYLDSFGRKINTRS